MWRSILFIAIEMTCGVACYASHMSEATSLLPMMPFPGATPTQMDKGSFRIQQGTLREIIGSMLAISTDGSTVPFSVKCMLALIILFILVNVILYIIQQVNLFRSKFLEKDADINDPPKVKEEEQLFNDVALGNAESSLAFTPVVALMIMFLLFRTYNDNLDINGKNWRSIQIGVGMVTIGVIIQALDSLRVTARSNVLAGVAESLGTLLIWTGYLFLVTGMFVERSSIVPMSVASKAFVAVAVLVLLTQIIIKMIHLKARFLADISPMDESQRMANRQRLEELQSTADFGPLLMIVFFYLHFRYVKLGHVPEAADIGMVGATIGAYCQIAAIVLKTRWRDIAVYGYAISVISTYSFVILCIVAAVDAGWPPPSYAIEGSLMLLIAMAVLKLLTIGLQQWAIVSVTGSDHPYYLRVHKLFLDMELTTRYGVILCVLLLYIHFRAVFMLKVEPETFVEDMGYLQPMIAISVVCVYAQILLLGIELGFGVSSASVCLLMLAVAAVNVALCGITYAAIET